MLYYRTVVATAATINHPWMPLECHTNGTPVGVSNITWARNYDGGSGQVNVRLHVTFDDPKDAQNFIAVGTLTGSSPTSDVTAVRVFARAARFAVALVSSGAGADHESVTFTLLQPG